MKKYEKEPWSASERELLKDYYHTLSEGAMGMILPGRTRNAMTKQVSYLKKRGWYFRKEPK